MQNLSIDPAFSIRTSIADTVFVDPVSKTPIHITQVDGNVLFGGPLVDLSMSVHSTANTKHDFRKTTVGDLMY